MNKPRHPTTVIRHPIISIIAAMGSDRTIGKDNKIPWDIPEDMMYLRETTRGKPVIMGRSTYESIAAYRGTNPKEQRAMPARFNVLVTSDAGYFGQSPMPEGVGLATTPEDGLRRAFDYAVQEKIDEIFVFGGATIYEALLDKTDRIYLTEIETAFHGDTFFPDFDTSRWNRVKHDQRQGFAFNIYEKIKP